MSSGNSPENRGIPRKSYLKVCVSPFFSCFVYYCLFFVYADFRQDLDSGFPCMSFHPDGLIVAGGTEERKPFGARDQP